MRLPAACLAALLSLPTLAGAQARTFRPMDCNRICFLLNGFPSRTLPITAIPTHDLDFIEFFPGGSYLSGNLALRWPLGTACGDKGRRAKQMIYVSVWTRTRRN